MQPRNRLTAKEVQVAGLVWEGRTNRDIAQALGTTEQVVKNYLRNTFDKLGVWSRLELALYVAAHGGTRWREPAALSPAASSGEQFPHPSAQLSTARAPLKTDPADQKSTKSAYRSKVSPRLISA